jgi:hypothetical protein
MASPKEKLPQPGNSSRRSISPYLFIICAEALSALLQKAEQTGALTGVPIARGRIKLNHLFFFANDSLLFCKATTMECDYLQGVLDTYESASGQCLNKEKTSIFFSRNTSDAIRLQITSLSGVQPTQCFDKYLGLPAMVGRSRTRTFKLVKDKIWSRISNWKVKFLSQARNEILLKVVVQAILHTL